MNEFKVGDCLKYDHSSIHDKNIQFITVLELFIDDHGQSCYKGYVTSSDNTIHEYITDRTVYLKYLTPASEAEKLLYGCAKFPQPTK